MTTYISLKKPAVDILKANIAENIRQSANQDISATIKIAADSPVIMALLAEVVQEQFPEQQALLNKMLMLQ